MTAFLSLRRYTEAEYLALEERADHRSEFYRGEIFAMSGGSINHNRIVLNAVSVLRTQLEAAPCEVFASDMRLLVEQHRLYTCPDVAVVCGRPELVAGRNDTLTNPVVIIEVLSESTERYDRADNFPFCRAIPTLREYVVIDQYTPRVEHYWKGADDVWMFEEIGGMDGALELRAIPAVLALRDLYARVEFNAGD